MTLTLSVLNQANACVFVCTGAGKKDVVKRVLEDHDEAYPAARVRPTMGKLYWLLDEAAASELDKKLYE